MDRAKRGVGLFRLEDASGRVVFAGETVPAMKPGETVMKVGKGKERIYRTREGETDEKARIVAPHFVRPDAFSIGKGAIQIHDLALNARAVRKGWIKTGFLLAGCASQGAAWKAPWADSVREYLMSDQEQTSSAWVIQKETRLECIFVTKDPSPGYVVIWRDWTIWMGIPERYEMADFWEIEIGQVMRGPLIYGQGKLERSGID